MIGGDDRSLALGEDAGLRSTHAGDVADCVHALARGLQAQWVHRNPLAYEGVRPKLDVAYGECTSRRRTLRTGLS